MNARLTLFTASAFLTLSGIEAQAQLPPVERDSSIDNLVLPPGARVAAAGALGAVVRRGSGPIDVVLIPGWGFGAEVFEGFMQANSARYRMVAVTLPGFGGTPSPALPTGTSYGAEPWTRAAASAIGQLIATERLRKPIVVGHFITGTQIALRLAAERADVIGGVVIAGGPPMVYLPGRPNVGPADRAAFVDTFTAPRFFRRVTKQGFVANNFLPSHYATDSARARALWQLSVDVPLPIMIQYLCEYWAADYEAVVSNIKVPTTVLLPQFTPELLASTPPVAKPMYIDAWSRIGPRSRLVSVQPVPDSRAFVSEDRPEILRAAIDSLAGRRAP